MNISILISFVMLFAMSANAESKRKFVQGDNVEKYTAKSNSSVTPASAEATPGMEDNSVTEDFLNGKSSFLLEDGKPWFLVKRTKLTEQNEISMTVEYKNSDGALLSKEEVVLSKPFRLKSYQWNRVQTGDKAEAKLSGNSLGFIYSKKGQPQPKIVEEQIAQEELDSLMVPSIIQDYIVFHWDELQKGSKKIRLVVPERGDTFRFTIDKTKEDNVWKLSADSMVIAMTVSPITFRFDNNKNLLKILTAKPAALFKTKSGSFEEKTTDIIYFR